jgi:transketolase
MRIEFARTIVELAATRDDLVFISGDLGYMALEEVQAALGSRFINAGVAEQNMVSMAAGLAAQGFTPIVYSIAPFATCRPFEQIRNDVCLHNLSVKIVGNGGGYGYGIMGSTHHALEDVAIMRGLPSMRVYTPCFGGDVATCVEAALATDGPCYLRLGKSVKSLNDSGDPAKWSAFRRISSGSKVVIAVMGPVIENAISALQRLPPNTVDLWAVGEFPISQLSADFIRSVAHTKRLITVEEHYRSGGLYENLAPFLLGLPNLRVEPLYAHGYQSGLYGSQKWHQDENGLGADNIERTILGSLAA